jgi:serine/threonine protein kinase
MLVCPECGLTQAHGNACPADGTPLGPRGDDPLIGQTLGAYRLARLLGVGGMGRVYKGVHPGIGSRVAVKVLSYECAQRHDLVERFFAEARAVNLIRHESIVNVLDLATLPDNRPYIIMEYLDGAPLSGLIERAGPLPLGSLAKLIAEVLDALGAAHATGIVHRDLKPDNIFVTPAGRPKVLDFGIAKLQQNLGTGSATQTGSLLGTPHYMSPEQAMGAAIDHRTDIYAIGVILFECVTGHRPFHAGSLFELLRKHVDEPPPSPRTLRPDLTPMFEHVIQRALAKRPDERWPSTAVLTQALQAATQGLGADAWTPITPATAGSLSAQRTPMSWPSGPQSWPGPAAAPPPTAPGAAATATATGPAAAPGAAATATSGQVMPGPTPAPAARRGGKGIALCLAAAAILVGGGAAAYLATRDGDAASPRADRGQALAEDGRADRAAAGDGDDDDADDDDRADPAEAVDDLEARIDDLIARELGKVGTSLDSLGTALGDAFGKAGPATTTATTTTTAAGGGGVTTVSPDTITTLDRPPDFDPKAFDVTGYYPTAEAWAKQLWPDAELVRLDASGVRPDGRADVTLDRSFYVRYWFRSPKVSERPADLPIGVDHKAKCNVQIWIDASGIKAIPFEWDCDEALIPKPTCSLEQAWAKAHKLGAPSGNAVAQIVYMTNIVTKKTVWYVQVGDQFSQQFPDGC